MTITTLGRSRSTFAHVVQYGARRLEWATLLLSLTLAVLILSHPHADAFKTIIIGLAAAGLVAWIVIQDFTTFTIADCAVAALACLAIADRWSAGDALVAVALDGLLIGGPLIAFREIYYRRKGIDGLGLGDVKLAAAGALLIGATALAWALFAASLLALGFVALRRIAAGIGKPGVLPMRSSDRLAFGVVLAPTIWAVWAGQHLFVGS